MKNEIEDRDRSSASDFFETPCSPGGTGAEPPTYKGAVGWIGLITVRETASDKAGMTKRRKQ
jgi:hypothetical protein